MQPIGEKKQQRQTLQMGVMSSTLGLLSTLGTGFLYSLFPFCLPSNPRLRVFYRKCCPFIAKLSSIRPVFAMTGEGE